MMKTDSPDRWLGVDSDVQTSPVQACRELSSLASHAQASKGRASGLFGDMAGCDHAMLDKRVQMKWSSISCRMQMSAASSKALGLWQLHTLESMVFPQLSTSQALTWACRLLSLLLLTSSARAPMQASSLRQLQPVEQTALLGRL